MPSYRATVSDQMGRVSTLVIAGDSRDDIRSRLTRQGMYTVAIAPAGASRFGSRAMSTADAETGLKVLARLMMSGLPVLSALDAMKDSAPPAWRAALPAIQDRVREGGSLSDGLATSSINLPDAVLGTIRAGEAASDAGSALARAAELLGRHAALKHDVANALRYPVILAAASFLSFAVMVFVVLPRFEQVLLDLDETLPPALALLLLTGDLARHAVLPLTAVCLISLVTWRNWLQSPDGRLRWHEMLLNAPLVGPYRHAVATARVADAMATLVQSGMPVAHALVEASSACGDSAIKARLHRSRELLNEGCSIASAVRMSRGLTPTAVFLLSAAEDAGAMGEMLTHIAHMDSHASATMIRRAVQFAEPALITVLAVVITAVAAALLQALYGMQPSF